MSNVQADYVVHVIAEARNYSPVINVFASRKPITLERLIFAYARDAGFDWDRDSITIVDGGPSAVVDLDAWEAANPVCDEEDVA